MEIIQKNLSFKNKLIFLDENQGEWKAVMSSPKIVGRINNDSGTHANAIKKHSGWKQVMDGIKKEHPYFKPLE